MQSNNDTSDKEAWPQNNDAKHPRTEVYNDDNVRKIQLKKNGHNTPWYITPEMKIYGKYLDNLTKKIEAREIATSGGEKFSVVVAQMWESNYFTEESLIKW